ncbi:hypothetical protein [Rhizobium phaseoli]|nr:hypothetical protein [Rhizobium phaseoli]ANL91904.1 hypothetical protein AMC80_CH02636 [Rhizobium phaseoli]MDK4728094.1 hypothetical protein [Rhizobium phaseoli]NKE90524.1 hypothetical protein [Rhizobium phaseoli]PDS69242.1 hypothetical protein CO651_24735 [Rhizobium phaseoli]
MTEEMLCFAMEQAAVRPFDSAQGTALALRVAQGVVAAIDSLDRLLGLRPTMDDAGNAGQKPRKGKAAITTLM